MVRGMTATSALDALCVSLAELIGRRLGAPPDKIVLTWDPRAKSRARWDAETVVGALRITANSGSPRAALRALGDRVRQLTGGAT